MKKYYFTIFLLFASSVIYADCKTDNCQDSDAVDKAQSNDLKNEWTKKCEHYLFDYYCMGGKLTVQTTMDAPNGGVFHENGNKHAVYIEKNHSIITLTSKEDIIIGLTKSQPYTNIKQWSEFVGQIKKSLKDEGINDSTINPDLLKSIKKVKRIISRKYGKVSHAWLLDNYEANAIINTDFMVFNITLKNKQKAKFSKTKPVSPRDIIEVLYE